MTELVRRARGYVRFYVNGQAQEKFLNEAARARIPLWQIVRSGQKTTACAPCARYRQLSRTARACGVRLRVCQRRGIPFLLQKMRARPGIPLGLLLFVTVQVILSGFVWQINVYGNTQVQSDRILQIAQSAGVHIGAPHSLLDTDAVRSALLRQLPELAWVGVNRLGARFDIEVRERSLQPEMVPVDEPCNLKARTGGVIWRVQAEDGFSVVRAGDVVQAGDLLVEGLRQDATGATILHHARGQVLAVTAHSFTYVQPFTYTVQQDTTHTVVRRRLLLFGMSLPLTFSQAPKDGVYRRTVRDEPLMLLGITWPVTVRTEIWVEQMYAQQTCTEAQALALARAALAEKLQTTLGQVQLLSQEEHVQISSGAANVTVTVTCIENIAVEEAIYTQSDTEE